MRERGFDKKRTKHGVVWTGLKLRDGGSDPTPDTPSGVDPTPLEFRIDKPDSKDVPGEGVGYEPNFRLSARALTRDMEFNPESATLPYTPTPQQDAQARFRESVGE